MTEIEAAVIDSAKRWLRAKEAILAADEAGEEPENTMRALDDAEYELTDALYRALGREPTLPVSRRS
jgi:hypothetical protein